MNKKILIIEDEKSLCDAIKFKLEHLGVDAIAINSAEKAMEIFKKNGINLIWLDLKLPKMNGIDFLKLLKDNLQLGNTKVVIVSVSGSDEVKEKAKNLGAVDYFVKNEFKLDDIINRVVAIA